MRYAIYTERFPKSHTVELLSRKLHSIHGKCMVSLKRTNGARARLLLQSSARKKDSKVSLFKIS